MANVAAIILAAGQGRRMKSAVPKVAHAILGKPVLWHVAQAARKAGIGEIVFVVGHGREAVMPVVNAFGGRFAVQERQLGTGDAVKCGLAELSKEAAEVVVLCGDAPLIRSSTIKALVAERRKRKAAAAVLTGILPTPAGYGRIVRTKDGCVARIVEERDADASTRSIKEINSGTYAFDRAFLKRNIVRISDVNAQREFYLTDMVIQALQDGRTVVPVVADDVDEVRGINSRRELAEAAAIVLREKLMALMESGVSILDPSRTYVEQGVTVGQDTTIEPGAMLLGATKVGVGVRIGQGCVIEDSRIGDGTVVRPYSLIYGSTVGKNAAIGPFAHLRPETLLSDEVHIGNFVETKKASFAKGAKANHLSYIGDASVGKKTNIGAGTITCNYDGIAKHKTTIGAGVFVGSDTQFVAPVTVGDGALIGAGSTITKDVPAFALALTRAEMRIFEGWVAKSKPELLKKAGLAAPKDKTGQAAAKKPAPKKTAKG